MLVRPVAALLGLAGGYVGGSIAHELAAAKFGDGSDLDRVLRRRPGGRRAGDQGGMWFDRNYQVEVNGFGANGGNLRLVRRPPTPPAARAATKGLPNIDTTKSGGPTFAGTDHLYPIGPKQKNVVDIPLTGSRPDDFTAANTEAGLDNTPDEYVWHHVDNYDAESGKSTLELVQKDAHQATLPHRGSVAQYEDATGKQYKR